MLTRVLLGFAAICLLVSTSIGSAESESLRILPGVEEKEARTAFDNANQLLIKYRIVRRDSSGESPTVTAAFDKAFSAYNQIIKSYPDTAMEARSLIGLCSLYHAKGDFKRLSNVMSSIEKRFAGTEFVRKAYFTLGLNYLQGSHDPAEALRWFKKIKLPPLHDPNDTSIMGMHNRELNRKTYVSVYQLMAKCEIWLGDSEKAAEYYEKLGRLFPELKETLDDDLESQVSNVLTEKSMKKLWPTLAAWQQMRRKKQAGDWLKDHQKSKDAAEEKRWGKQIAGMRCSIEMEPASLRVGDQFNITVKIKNVSDKSATFYYQDVYQAEKLIVKSDKGELVESQKTVVYNMPHPKTFFRTIKPDEMFIQQIKGRVTLQFMRAKELAEKDSDRPLLIDFRDVAVQIGQTGRFSVSLKLASDEKTVETGKYWGFEGIWTGEILSNEIEFSVRPMRQDELDKVIKQLEARDPNQKSQAIQIIKANCDKQAVDALMGELYSGRNTHLRAISGALIWIQDTSIVPDLLEMYRLSVRYGNERDAERQSIILQTVRSLEPDQEKIDKLFIDVLNSSASIDARRFAAYELGTRKPSGALAALIVVAKKHEPRMQWAAIDAMGNIGSHFEISDKAKVIEPLTEIMRNDPDHRVRRRAVSGLGQVGSELVVPILTEALKDPDLFVGAAAANYLGRYAGPDVIVELNEYKKRTQKKSQTKAAEKAIESIQQRTDSRK